MFVTTTFSQKEVNWVIINFKIIEKLYILIIITLNLHMVEYA